MRRKNKKGKSKSKTLDGIITTTRGGLGFFTLDGKPRAVRIEYDNLNTALNGDRVVVLIRPGKDGLTGTVVKILGRTKKRYVGVLEMEGGSFYLIPDDPRMYVDIRVPSPEGARPGEKAFVEITGWADENESPEGRIVSVIGKRGEHEAEIASIILERGIDAVFPAPVLEEARAIQESWYKKESKEINALVGSGGRRDFRSIPTFTIDPSDAKDFDDAISFQKLDNETYEVGVHIADVSHFVRRDTALDREARKRGFTVYLVDRTIPMLPPELSTDIASLNENVDRLTFSAIFTIRHGGEITGRWFGKSVIHSDKRFSYEEAQKIIDTGAGEHAPVLKILNDLAKKYKAERFKKGSIDFDQDEVKVEVDERGTPIRIYRKERLDTHKLIEEFMLLANKEVATHIHRGAEENKKKGSKPKRGLVYRVHDLPNVDKLQNLSLLLKTLGHTFHVDETGVTAEEINTLLKSLEGSEIEGLVKTAMVRSMAKAVYTTKNIGHFGLGFGYYTHFTSPIRRYSDLLVHRILYDELHGKTIANNEFSEYTKLADDLSIKEISIQEAERESVKYKQVEFMKNKIGEVFEGIISGVTEWGIYVEERETGAEGMIRLKDMRDDYFELKDHGHQLIGRKTKKTYTLGDSIRIKVVGADVDRKTLDFALAE